METKHLIENLELLNKEIPNIENIAFMEKYFTYTIEETIKKLKENDNKIKEMQETLDSISFAN